MIWSSICRVLNRPEPHVLLFRRPLGTNAQTGLVEPELEKAAKEKYLSDFASNLMR
jgi:cyclin-dependent kinase regulatory subunit CKS1